MTYCPACGAENEEAMGQLGSLIWFRCRACGMPYSTERREDDFDDLAQPEEDT